jgi:hypothetical protein
MITSVVIIADLHYYNTTPAKAGVWPPPIGGMTHETRRRACQTPAFAGVVCGGMSQKS